MLVEAMGKAMTGGIYKGVRLIQDRGIDPNDRTLVESLLKETWENTVFEVLRESGKEEAAEIWKSLAPEQKKNFTRNMKECTFSHFIDQVLVRLSSPKSP